jgi:hypothetical protein
MKPEKEKSWGVIRYAPGSGVRCEDDAAGFDGWYSIRGWAVDVAEYWVKEYPGWIVAIIQSDQIWFGQGDFSNWSKPLTIPERSITRRIVD